MPPSPPTETIPLDYPSPEQQQQQQPLITPFPTPPNENDSPTNVFQEETTAFGNNLLPRADVVTVSLTTTQPSATADASASSNKFPVAVAVPALVGGMALALIGAGLWWWISKKREKERRRRWESAQRRRRKRERANSNPSRPSLSGARRATTDKSPIEEKGFVPPVPPLPSAHDGSNPHNQYYKPEQGYGYDQQPQHPHPNPNPQYPNGGGQAPMTYNNAYEPTSPVSSKQQQHPIQPSLDEYERSTPESYENDPTPDYSSQPDNHSSKNDLYVQVQPPSTAVTSPSNSSPLGEKSLNEEYGVSPSPSKSEKSGKSGSKASRSAARIAAADNAAARQANDPDTRWRPNKPSPLAIKAAEEKKRLAAAAVAAAGGYGGQGGEEMMNDDDYNYQSNQNGVSQRVISGEWGVAGETRISEDSSYGGGHHAKLSGGGGGGFDDPYLKVGNGGGPAGGNRAPSGQYTTDPYAMYHDRQSGQAQVDYHDIAREMKRGGAGWV